MSDDENNAILKKAEQYSDNVDRRTGYYDGYVACYNELIPELEQLRVQNSHLYNDLTFTSNELTQLRKEVEDLREFKRTHQPIYVDPMAQ